jgi:hypothetical protein
MSQFHDFSKGLIFVSLCVAKQTIGITLSACVGGGGGFCQVKFAG